MSEPVAPIDSRRLQLDATQMKQLRELFVSQGYILLKGVVASRCVELQIDSINRQLYPSNEMSVERAKDSIAEARELNAILQILDELEGDEARWYTVTPERRP